MECNCIRISEPRYDESIDGLLSITLEIAHKWKTSVLDLETILKYLFLVYCFDRRVASIYYLSNYYKMCSEHFVWYLFTAVVIFFWAFISYVHVLRMSLNASTSVEMLKTSAPLYSEQPLSIHILYGGYFGIPECILHTRSLIIDIHYAQAQDRLN